MAGYGTSTEAMGKAADGISGAAKDAAGDLKDLGKTKLDGKHFGEAHQQHLQGYQAGITNLAQMITGLEGALTGFASQLDAGASTYGNVESNNATNLERQY